MRKEKYNAYCFAEQKTESEGAVNPRIVYAAKKVVSPDITYIYTDFLIPGCDFRGLLATMTVYIPLGR